MAQAKGSMSQLMGGIKETTYGTTPSTPTGYSLPFVSTTLKGERNLVASKVIRGNRNPTAPDQGNTNVGGNVVVPVDLIGIGYWLEMLLGAPTTTGVGPYVHTFKVPTSVPSWVIELGYLDITKYLVYNGCKAESIAFKFGGDEELTATVELLGAKETAGTASIDATVSTFTITKFGNFQAAVTEGGSSIATVQEINMTIKNNLDANTFCIGGSGIRPSLPEGVVAVSGSIKAMFEDLTLLNKAINGTESSLVVTLTSGTSSLVLAVDELLYRRNAPGVPTPGGIWVDLPFEGYYSDDADASAFQAVLTNSQATYPS